MMKQRDRMRRAFGRAVWRRRRSDQLDLRAAAFALPESLESRVLVSARRFRELGAASTAVDIAVVEPVEKAPRTLKLL